MNKTAKAYFNENPLKNGVLKITTYNKTMNLEKLNEIKAKVASTDDPVTLKECVANTVLFADEIAKKSEEMEAAFADHKKLMEDAIKQKAEAEKLHESVKHEMEALKTKLQDMEDGHKAAESERKFNARMSKLEADYDMDDGCRAIVSKKISAMSDEDYASYEMDLQALMKEKSKTYKQELSEKLKAALAKTKEEDEAEAKKKKEMEAKTKEDEEEEEAEGSLIVALASASENPVDPLFNNVDPATIGSLKEQLKQSFGKDISIGNETLGELEVKRKKKLE